MLETWTDLLQKLPPVHTLVHVGAGRGVDFPLYARLKAKRVVLIEPQVKLAQQLESADTPFDLTVVNRAVDSESRLRTFYQANNSHFSGFTHPKELQAHFPDLRLESEFTIDTWRLAECIDELVSTKGNNLLILDVPDVAIDLLDSLEQPMMGMFRWIVGQYLASDISDRTLTKRCKDSAFWSLILPANPPYSVFFAERNPMTPALAKSEEQVKTLEARYKASATEQERLTKKIETLKSESEALTQSSERELESLKMEVETLRSESEALGQSSAQELESLKMEVETLRAQNDALESESAVLQKETEEIRLARDELSHRQRLLDDEVLRAEAQLTLIKEVLIRDKI